MCATEAGASRGLAGVAVSGVFAVESGDELSVDLVGGGEFLVALGELLFRFGQGVTDPATWADRLHAAEGQPGFAPGVHDRLALFLHTTKVLQLIAQPRAWNAVEALGRSPEHLRAHLRRQLAWIPGRKWVLVEALTDELIRSRRSRLAQLDALLSRHLPPEPSGEEPV